MARPGMAEFPVRNVNRDRCQAHISLSITIPCICAIGGLFWYPILAHKPLPLTGVHLPIPTSLEIRWVPKRIFPPLIHFLPYQLGGLPGHDHPIIRSIQNQDGRQAYREPGYVL